MTRGLTMLVALGALAVGAAAAMMNNERMRQMRQDLERQIDDLSTRLDRTLEERRPEIEDAIQRSRRAAVEGLDRVRGVVEQSADKAQEYVHRASVRTSEMTADSGERTEATMYDAGEPVEAGTSGTSTAQSWTSEPGAPEFSGGTDTGDGGDSGEPTRRMDGDGNADNTTSNPGH